MQVWDPLADGAEADEDAVDIKYSVPVPEIEIPYELGGLDDYEPDDLKRLFKGWEMETEAAGPWTKAPWNKPKLNWHVPACHGERDWCHEDVLLKFGQGIAYITLNRPAHGNALNDSMMDGLIDAMFIISGKKDIRITVIMAEGPIFCAGDDPDAIKHRRDGTIPSVGDGSKANRVPHKKQGAAKIELDKLAADAVKCGAFPEGEVDYFILKQALMWQTLSRIHPVTIALCQGSAIGSGLGILSVCDLSFAVEGAFFSCDEGKRGLMPSLISPYLVQKSGANYAKLLMASGRVFTATEAKEANLIQEVVEDIDWGHGKIWEIALAVNACGPGSVTAAKELVAGVAGQPITLSIIFFTTALLGMVTVSDEARDGMLCLQQKRLKPWEEDEAIVKPLYEGKKNSPRQPV